MATTTENLGLTLPAGTDRALVSVLNENFQTLDDFAGHATDDIQQAQETANAAAPQATTYTKTEVDIALAAKLNTADVDSSLSSTSANPVQNKAVQAPIARLVDAGAKNLLKVTATSQTINGVTFTVNSDGTVTVNGTSTAVISFVLNSTVGLESGSYVLSGCPSGGSWNSYYLTARSNGSWLSSPDFGNSAPINGTVTQVVISIQSGQTVNNLTFEPMLCTAEDYAISPEIVPYTPTIRELYEMILAMQNGG